MRLVRLSFQIRFLGWGQRAGSEPGPSPKHLHFLLTFPLAVVAQLS